MTFDAGYSDEPVFFCPADRGKPTGGDLKGFQRAQR